MTVGSPGPIVANNGACFTGSGTGWPYGPSPHRPSFDGSTISVTLLLPLPVAPFPSPSDSIIFFMFALVCATESWSREIYQHTHGWDYFKTHEGSSQENHTSVNLSIVQAYLTSKIYWHLAESKKWTLGNVLLSHGFSLRGLYLIYHLEKFNKCLVNIALSVTDMQLLQSSPSFGYFICNHFF